MKHARLLIGILLALVIFSAFRYFGGNQSTPKKLIASPTPNIKTLSTQRSTSLFVPYWSLGLPLPEEYDRLIYFGVSASDTGLATDDTGYQNLSEFTTSIPSNISTSLTLRMLDNTTNFAILKNSSLQKRIISQTIQAARQNGFDGIVLDLEIKALPFESLLNQVNDFTSVFYQEAKKADLHFAITLYGDTFYRVRPFEVSAVAKNADEVMLMAYDFHKAGGSTPGPNFPLNGRETYGYDFKQMVTGFQKQIPNEKLTVIFGYFGYDWPVDEKGVAINIGAPFSYNQITQQYLTGCDSCVITRDSLSAETKVTYTSGDDIKHTVWFEDAESIRQKEEYLKSQGITSYSYWAHSYF